MVITFVIDMIGAANNGTTITAMRSAEILRNHGHEVRFITLLPNKELSLPFDKIMESKKIYFGVFESMVNSNGMLLSYLPNKQFPEVKKFLEGSDIVHIMMVSILGSQVRLIAKAMGIPISCAMHIQPENISYNISYNFGKSKFINSLFYSYFRNQLYKYIRNVHTPSQMMKEQMIAHGYTKNDIYVISNGVSPRFVPTKTEKPIELKDKFVILMIGRLSREKRQDLLIKAIGMSKHKDNIHLILLGQGPRKKQYTNLAKKFLGENNFTNLLVTQEKLFEIVGYTDLYVHASDAESEAIACIEAFCCGRVPIISDSKVSATNHFALDEKCLFKNGNYKDLSAKIDYFYEHPQEIERLSAEYIEYGKTFNLEKCVYMLEDMFNRTIEQENKLKSEQKAFYASPLETHRLKKTAKKAEISDPYIFKKRNKN